MQALRQHGLLKGRRLGSSIMEANASLRGLEHRNSEQSYWEYVKGLAVQAGVDPQDTNLTPISHAIGVRQITPAGFGLCFTTESQKGIFYHSSPTVAGSFHPVQDLVRVSIANLVCMRSYDDAPGSAALGFLIWFDEAASGQTASFLPAPGVVPARPLEQSPRATAPAPPPRRFRAPRALPPCRNCRTSARASPPTRRRAMRSSAT